MTAMKLKKEKNDQLRVFHRWMLKQTAEIEKFDDDILKQHLHQLREMQNRSALKTAWQRVLDTFESDHRKDVA
jgi:hypothetical protein